MRGQLTRGGSPSTRQDQARQARKAGKSSDFSLKTDMLFRLLASTQSGIIPNEGRMEQARQARLENWRSSRTVTRRGREITCGSPSDGLTPHWSDVSPNASIPAMAEVRAAQLTFDWLPPAWGLSIPSHRAAFPSLPCRLVTLSLCHFVAWNVANSAWMRWMLDALDALRCIPDHHPKVTGVLCIA